MTQIQVVGVKKYHRTAFLPLSSIAAKTPLLRNSGTMPLLRNSGAALNSGNSLSCHYTGTFNMPTSYQ